MSRTPAGVNTVRSQWEYVFSGPTRSALRELLDFDERAVPERMDSAAVINSVRNANVVLATWGAYPFTKEVLDACPNLQLVVYGAGSVKGIVTEDLIERGVRVCSAVHLNAWPVAEFVLGMVFMALKDVFAFNRELHEKGPHAWDFSKESFPGGYYQTRVGLLGYGRISEQLIWLLQKHDMEVMLADEHVTPELAERLGIGLASCEEVMSSCDVVSLHHADTPKNRHMINRDKLALLKPGAHFINTSRGRLVDEDALVEKLREGDITAYLDVTDPEPPVKGHPFYDLPNCILTPHVAGSIGKEAHRMGDFCLREVSNWLGGRALENEIDLSTVFERA